jgi:hypothetical protein
MAPAIRLAKEYVAESLAAGPKIGRGPGPLNHFSRYYAWDEPATENATPPEKGLAKT